MIKTFRPGLWPHGGSTATHRASASAAHLMFDTGFGPPRAAEQPALRPDPAGGQRGDEQEARRTDTPVMWRDGRRPLCGPLAAEGIGGLGWRGAAARGRQSSLAARLTNDLAFRPGSGSVLARALPVRTTRNRRPSMHAVPARTSTTNHPYSRSPPTRTTACFAPLCRADKAPRACRAATTSSRRTRHADRAPSPSSATHFEAVHPKPASHTSVKDLLHAANVHLRPISTTSPRPTRSPRG